MGSPENSQRKPMHLISKTSTQTFLEKLRIHIYLPYLWNCVCTETSYGRRAPTTPCKNQNPARLSKLAGGGDINGKNQKGRRER